MFKSMQLTVHYFNLEACIHKMYGYFLLLYLGKVIGKKWGWDLSQLQISVKNLFCGTSGGMYV